jgi:hypothetical protein
MTDALGRRLRHRGIYLIVSSRKLRSRKKNSSKKATVEREVQMTRMVAKMNQPARQKAERRLRAGAPSNYSQHPSSLAPNQGKVRFDSVSQHQV